MLPEPMTQSEIAEVEKLLEKVTKGPWKLDDRAGCVAVYEASKDYVCLDGIIDLFIHYKGGKNLEGIGWWVDPVHLANADFIARSRELVPRLLETIRSMDEALKGLVDVVKGEGWESKDCAELAKAEALLLRDEGEKK